MVKIERRITKVNRFTEILYSPIAWVTILTFLSTFSIFAIRSLLIEPLRTEILKEISRIENKNDLEHLQIYNKIAWNLAEMQTHKSWCDKNVIKALEDRPTKNELKLVFEPLNNELSNVKNELLEIKKILLNKNTRE